MIPLPRHSISLWLVSLSFLPSFLVGRWSCSVAAAFAVVGSSSSSRGWRPQTTSLPPAPFRGVPRTSHSFQDCLLSTSSSLETQSCGHKRRRTTSRASFSLSATEQQRSMQEEEKTSTGVERVAAVETLLATETEPQRGALQPTIAHQTEEATSSEFVNDGPLSWMTTYLDAMGIQEGRAIYYGPIPGEVDETKRPSESESVALRQQATQELMNINKDERQRRNQAGQVMTVLSIAYIAWAALVADDGGFTGHILRFLSVIPLFLAVGYKRSAATGLCNVAQSGLWDVDGNGLTRIEDPNLAQAILQRVNAMNLNTALQVGVPVTLFALVPQSTSAPLAFFLALFSLLYAVRNKVPKE